MNDAAKLIEALSSLLWPAIFVGALLLFRPAISAIIESARSRRFTLKIAGQELTMEEVSEQQRGLIADLQGQVVELRKAVESQGPQERALATVTSESGRLSAILWVDDRPKNNTYFVQQLRDLGVSVDLALSTAEGLERFENGRYDAVISDMGRAEDGVYKQTAGIDLLKAIRERNPTVPFVLFCSAQLVRQLATEAASHGATAITSSPTELFGVLQLEQRNRGT